MIFFLLGIFLLRLFHQVSHTLSEVPHLSRLRMQR
jgi:hypothetical protein